MTKFSIIVFPGSNCDKDALYAIENSLGAPAKFIWHKEGSLSNCDAILLPGGFSYGDYLRTGAIAKFSPIMKEVVRKAKDGMPVIGICNGFQILIESGLLPGALITNEKVKFLSQNVNLEVTNNNTVFTSLYDENQIISMPIAHGMGNYIADDDLLYQLNENKQIAFKYHKKNPNGSISSIAGIFNKNKNILGMMPHPERATESILGSLDGLEIFKSISNMS